MILTIYIDRTKRTYKDKIYIQTLLQESYRTKIDEVSKVKLRTVAYLTRFPPLEIPQASFSRSVPSLLIICL